MVRKRERVMGKCEGCGGKVNPKQAGTGKRIEGYVEVRGGGGAHGVIKMSEPKGFVCPTCLAALRRDISTSQGHLL